MNLIRRWSLFSLLSVAAILAACNTAPKVDPQISQVLAPTGKLRIGVYLGSPTSMVVTGLGEKTGVSIELGKELARQLGVEFELVEFSRVAEVLDGMTSGKVDFTFTNASAERAKRVDFTEPLVALELGYLVSVKSPMRTMEDADQPGMLIGVSQGSSSQATLTRVYKNAKVAPVASIKNGADLLKAGQLDAFATNKAVLFEMLDGLPGFKILDGRWGLEHLAIAIPKGRESGMPFVKQFALNAQSGGLLEKSAKRAGLRGTAKVEPQMTTAK
jgi:polar amino acid transport system substrate-binding protein